jgi:uncharacterized membrane protein YidH (DUF202 family)
MSSKASASGTGDDMFVRNPRDPIQNELPPIPTVDDADPDGASVTFSRHRTTLSTHRTFLSEHRTALSEHRTDLSTRRSEMSSRRTGMSFQRTRMSADRTLMAVIRTALAMISFGFTIYQGFRSLQQAGVIGAQGGNAAGLFGQALVYLGVGMLALGVLYHIQFMLALRRERAAMAGEGYIHAESPFPVSLTLVVAVLLLLIGVAAIAGIVFNLGPFN